MKKYLKLTFVVIIGLFISLNSICCAAVKKSPAPKPSQITLPARDKILKTMVAVNDYFISTHPDPGDCDWDRAVYFTGDMACYEATKNKKYLDYAIEWATQNNWNTFDTSKWPRKFGDTDEYCCGQTYLALNDISPSSNKTEGIKKHVDGLITAKPDQWWYTDNLYMGGPVLSKLSSVLNDKKYSDALYALYTDAKVKRQLYDAKDHLWYRDQKYLWPQYQTSNGKKCFWSRGNGWAIAAHARILSTLPKNDAHRQEYIDTFKAMAASLIKVQGSDGIWRASLYDSKDFPIIESSGTSLFTYALAWGINNGLLDKKTYYPVVAKAWNGLVSKCINLQNKNGFVGYVQVQADDPTMGQPIEDYYTEDYGYGAVLLAGSELVKMK